MSIILAFVRLFAAMAYDGLRIASLRRPRYQFPQNGFGLLIFAFAIMAWLAAWRHDGLAAGVSMLFFVWIVAAVSPRAAFGLAVLSIVYDVLFLALMPFLPTGEVGTAMRGQLELGLGVMETVGEIVFLVRLTAWPTRNA